MIKIEKTAVYGWDAAIRGMRNSHNSWDYSDSGYGCLDKTGMGISSCLNLCRNCGLFRCGKKDEDYFVGKNDLLLMKSLAKAGDDHSKFARMINVGCDITAPFYWWKEFDTYKVGTVANGCSTVHTIQDKEFTLDDFSFDEFFDLDDTILYVDEYENYMSFKEIIVKVCEQLRLNFLETNDRRYCNYLTQLLPSSYNQKRTVQLNYQVLWNMYKARKNHRLDEWKEFCAWIEKLPYFRGIFK